MDGKLGSVPLWGTGSWVPIEHNVIWAESYMHAKFHLYPSRRLATNGCPKPSFSITPYIYVLPNRLYKCSAVDEMCDRLATRDVPKIGEEGGGGCAPYGEAASQCNTT